MWKYLNLGKIGRLKWAELTCERQVAIEYCLSEIEFYED